MKINLVLILSLVILSMSLQCGAVLNRDNCRQPMTAGRCFGYVPSYAYDPIGGKCEEFIYGGCGGNENRFDTMKECEKTCRGI